VEDTKGHRDFGSVIGKQGGMLEQKITAGPLNNFHHNHHPTLADQAASERESSNTSTPSMLNTVEGSVPPKACHEGNGVGREAAEPDQLYGSLGPIAQKDQRPAGTPSW
jgi:hypothetical protein